MAVDVDLIHAGKLLMQYRYLQFLSFEVSNYIVL